jgi:hypothetical protein
MLRKTKDDKRISPVIDRGFFLEVVRPPAINSSARYHDTPTPLRRSNYTRQHLDNLLFFHQKFINLVNKFTELI